MPKDVTAAVTEYTPCPPVEIRRETSKIRVNVKGNAQGVLEVRTSEYGESAARIHIRPAKGEITGFSARLEGAGASEKEALFFVFTGKGSFNFYSFDLK